MSKHTKGTWHVNAAALTVDADGRPVADVRCSEIADEAIDANARLISSAPSLLAALVQLVTDLEGQAVVTGLNDKGARMLATARAAIALAEGDE